MDTCKICKTEFKRHYPRGGKRKIYCSRKCRYQDSFVDKTCLTCGKTFRTNVVSMRKEYCSLACIQRLPCQLCGKIITGRNKIQSGERRFCSHRCANVVNISLKGKNNYVSRGFAATIRRTGKIACERCGIDNIFVLTVHHADSDHGNIADENLITLCANCHAMEHFSGSIKRQRDALVAAFMAKFKI